MQALREVYSLLMPVQDGRIIVPRAAVAEVMGYTRPKERPENAPDFLLGFVDWQGQKIPLVSFEAARGQGVPELGRRTRIAVLFGIAGRLHPDVFAVVTQGYPYLVRVNENVLQPEGGVDEPLVLARVRMANEKPFIPDLEQLEQRIADGLGMKPEDAAAPVGTADELDALDGVDEDPEAGMLVDESAEATAPREESGDTDMAEVDVDLGEVTAFGTETNYASELDALSDALDMPEDDASVEDVADVDLDEVTAFGTQTNYSVELDALSDSLREDASGEETAETDGEFSIDLSGLELADNESGEDADTAADAESDADDIDFSDIRIDFDDDDEKSE